MRTSVEVTGDSALRGEAAIGEHARRGWHRDAAVGERERMNCVNGIGFDTRNDCI